MKNGWNGWGYRVHTISARVRLVAGEIINMRRFAVEGEEICLINSLIASANGCGRPIKPGLFGPLRSWKYPRNFRSIRV